MDILLERRIKTIELVQQAIEQGEVLQIDTSSFTYFDKKDIVLRYNEYSSVSIGTMEELVQSTTPNNSWNKIKEVLNMPSISRARRSR